MALSLSLHLSLEQTHLFCIFFSRSTHPTVLTVNNNDDGGCCCCSLSAAATIETVAAGFLFTPIRCLPAQEHILITHLYWTTVVGEVW